jgi:hypothetical protein
MLYGKCKYLEFVKKINIWIDFNDLFKFGDENNGTYPPRWSVPELKDHPTNISTFSRIYEEYTDAEHFFEFTRKTASILLQTSIKFHKTKTKMNLLSSL